MGAPFYWQPRLGWGMRGIQYLLPNRYYQFQDICLNSVSAALGLILVFAVYHGKENR
jgi:VanZ family protein